MLNVITFMYRVQSTMEQQNLSVNFERSLNLILKWLSFIDVHLKKKQLQRWRILVTQHKLAWFLTCISPHLILTIHLCAKEEIFDWIPTKRRKRSYSTVFYLNSFIDFIQPVGTNLCLLFSSKKWYDL